MTTSSLNSEKIGLAIKQADMLHQQGKFNAERTKGFV
jgi:hypothetical protein